MLSIVQTDVCLKMMIIFLYLKNLAFVEQLVTGFSMKRVIKFQLMISIGIASAVMCWICAALCVYSALS